MYFVFKRIVEVFIAVIALIMLSPLILIICIAIKLNCEHAQSMGIIMNLKCFFDTCFVTFSGKGVVEDATGAIEHTAKKIAHQGITQS